MKLSMECQGINHWFGDSKVLFDVNLQIAKGQIVGLVGPSGCGKSTLLRTIIGTHLPKSGKTIVYTSSSKEGLIVKGPSRDRGIVYQKYTLFPYLTALDNIVFGLILDKTNIPFRIFDHFGWFKLRKKFKEEAEHFLEKMNMIHVKDKYPHELSGGMCQRVAIAQALILKPEILLMDEPFGALDEHTREKLQKMLLSLYGENIDAVKKGEDPPYTIIIVTHELSEALYVGDRIVGLSQYWDWKDSHEKCPGATIIYDKVAPVFNPIFNSNEVKNVEFFLEQKEEVRDIVFNKEIAFKKDEHVTFWDQIKNGKGEGIFEKGLINV